MEKWAAQELQYADLGDTRRKKGLISIVENFASQPSISVSQVSGNLAAASATYDFWNSPYFQPSDLIAAQAKSTVERIKEHPIFLAVQDTTSLDLIIASLGFFWVEKATPRLLSGFGREISVETICLEPRRLDDISQTCKLSDQISSAIELP
jgi:hypothetical protein